MKNREIVLIATLLFQTQVGLAAITKFEYSGAIDSLYKSSDGKGSFVSSAEINGLTFSAGQRFIGSFSYDNSVSASEYDTSDDGLQIFSGGVMNYTFSIVESGYTFSAPSGNISLSPGLVPPIFTLDSIAFFAPISRSPYINSQVYLSGMNGKDVFDDYSLPELVPLDDLPYRSFYFEYVYAPTNETLISRSKIDSLLVINSVPEPQPFSLLLLGIGVLACQRRRVATRAPQGAPELP